MTNPTYDEIFVLKEMLEKASIPFDFAERPLEHGWQIFYPSRNKRIYSVVESDDSNGSSADLLEILGPLRDIYSDTILGCISASIVFELIAGFHKTYAKYLKEA